MKNNIRVINLFVRVLLGLALAGPLLCSDEKAPPLAGIQVSFKLDSRLASGVYGGERWVSPPTYIGANAQDTVEARALGLDAKGRPIRISPQWVPADPEMATVSPGQGDQVKITVKRAGESKLQVTAQGVSSELGIKAVSRNNILQVEIAQLAAKQPAEAVAAQGALKTPEEKRSYTLGVTVGNNIRKQSVEVDPGAFMQGFKDALAGSETALAEEEMRTILAEVQAEVKRRQEALQAEQVLAANRLAEKNKKDGEEFLAANKAKEGVVTLESGLQYRILKAGSGKKPALDDTVVCQYRGTLLDGTEFDSSYRRNKPATLPLKGAIKGWAEALQRMPAGSKWQLFIPSNLAYGERGAPRVKIGPNSTLIFEVELVSIQDMPSEKAQASPEVSAAKN